MGKEKQKSLPQILLEVNEEVCDNLCKYADTADQEGICEYIREHGGCPLDVLT